MHQLPAPWTNIELLSTGDQYFSELLNSFRRAEKHIQIEVYILNIDAVTRTLLEELMKARQRGVRVQILVDGIGSFLSIADLESFCERHGIEFRVYQPLPLFSRGSKRMMWVYLASLMGLIRKMNRRNHRKIVIVDYKTAFVGSMNWSQVHSRRALANRAWRDTAVIVQGPEVKLLRYAFRVDWYRATKMAFKRFRKKAPLLKNYDPRFSAVRLNSSLRDRWRLHRDLLNRIKEAKKHVWLTTAYFLPHPSLMRALRKASARGVSVKILVPGQSDVPLVQWAAFELVHQLSRGGVQIYEYQTSILHAKVVIIDDWATIGSTNLNYRSFFHDLESEIVVTDPQVLNQLIKQWELDLQNSRPFDISVYEKASWFRRIVSRWAFRLRYWL